MPVFESGHLKESEGILGETAHAPIRPSRATPAPARLRLRWVMSRLLTVRKETDLMSSSESPTWRPWIVMFRSLRALSGHFRRSGQIVGGIASRCYQQSGENIRLWRCGGLFLRPLGIASRCYQQQGETVSRQLSVQELDIVLAHLKTHDHSFVAKCSGSNCLSGYLRA